MKERLRPHKLDMNDKSPIGPAFWCIPTDNITKEELDQQDVGEYLGVDNVNGNRVHVFQLANPVLSEVQEIHRSKEKNHEANL